MELDIRLLRSPLLHFLVAGALLFVAQTVWNRAPETPRVEVFRSEIEERTGVYRQQMGRAPSPPEQKAIEAQAIENALWLQQARALGLHEIDSVVRQRLILNMRFLEGAEADPGDGSIDQALFERAIELGMDRTDTVVQRRLVDRVQAIIRARVRAEPFEERELEAHFEENHEKWREPPLLDLVHVYFSRDKRGASALDDAARLLPEIVAAGIPADEALAEGDPFLAGHRLRGATPNRVIARLGPDFANGVEAAPVEQWFGPVPSAFGQHLVWIDRRVESRIPDLAEIRNRVVEDWIEERSRAALREHIEARKSQVEVAIVEDGSAGKDGAENEDS